MVVFEPGFEILHEFRADALVAHGGVGHNNAQGSAVFRPELEMGVGGEGVLPIEDEMPVVFMGESPGIGVFYRELVEEIGLAITPYGIPFRFGRA